jgi:hypothetical protein
MNLKLHTIRVLRQSAFRRSLTPRSETQSRVLLAINLKQRRRFYLALYERTHATPCNVLPYPAWLHDTL